MTLGVLPIEPERERLLKAGLNPGSIDEIDGYFIMRILDPEQNLPSRFRQRKEIVASLNSFRRSNVIVGLDVVTEIINCARK